MIPITLIKQACTQGPVLHSWYGLVAQHAQPTLFALCLLHAPALLAFMTVLPEVYELPRFAERSTVFHSRLWSRKVPEGLGFRGRGVGQIGLLFAFDGKLLPLPQTPVLVVSD